MMVMKIYRIIILLLVSLLFVHVDSQHGTIEPNPRFNPVNEAKAMGQALIGFGTDVNKLVNVITRNNNAQRQEIAKAYKALYRRDLVDHIKSDTNRKFEDTLVGLMTPTADYDAQLIRKSIKGLGTDFDTLIEVLLTRTPAQIQEIQKAYRRLYKKDIASSIKGDTHGYVEDLLVAISKGDRDQSNNVDPAAALADAKYQRLSRHSIEEAIMKETSGKIQKSMLVLTEAVRHPASFFAKRLRHAMKTFIGTKDRDLNRILISRSETDLEDIKDEYFKMFRVPLEKDIRNDVSGKFRDILIALVRGNRQPIAI